MTPVSRAISSRNNSVIGRGVALIHRGRAVTGYFLVANASLLLLLALFAGKSESDSADIVLAASAGCAELSAW